MTYKGIIRGKSIELDESLPFPEGAKVTISVLPDSRAEPERGSPEALRSFLSHRPELEPGDVDELERAIRDSRRPLSKACEL